MIRSIGHSFRRISYSKGVKTFAMYKWLIFRIMTDRRSNELLHPMTDCNSEKCMFTVLVKSKYDLLLCYSSSGKATYFTAVQEIIGKNAFLGRPLLFTSVPKSKSMLLLFLTNISFSVFISIFTIF